jgi:hypothetical protein
MPLHLPNIPLRPSIIPWKLSLHFNSSIYQFTYIDPPFYSAVHYSTHPLTTSIGRSFFPPPWCSYHVTAPIVTHPSSTEKCTTIFLESKAKSEYLPICCIYGPYLRRININKKGFYATCVEFETETEIENEVVDMLWCEVEVL